MTDVSSIAADRGRGVLYGAMAGVALSLGGLIVRLMSADTSGWQMLTWRSLAFAALMFTIALVRTRSPRQVIRNIAGAGWLGVGVALTVGLGQIAYLMGLIHTSVANVTFLLGSAPIVVAFAGWLVLGERLSGMGVMTLGAAMFGIAIMFSSGVSGGDALGVAYAAGALVAYASMVLLLRKAGPIDTFAVTGVGGLLSAGISIWVAGGDMAIIPADAALSIVSGVFQVGAGFALIALAARYIKAAEVTLLVLLETILGPLLVWIFISETPAPVTLGGGAIVILSVAAFAILTREKN
jgi:drug/metabolite transporter, DME family